jgi:hypothetical protein
MHSHDNMFDPWDAIVVSQKRRCANIWIVDNHGGRAIDGPNIKFINIWIVVCPSTRETSYVNIFNQETKLF